MKTWTWIAMLVVLGVSMSAMARPGKQRGADDGDGPRAGRGGHGGPGFGLCLALRDPALGVTDAQSDQLKPLCRAERDKASALLDSRADLKDAVRAELENDAPDFDRVAALHQQMATLKTEMARQHVALRSQVRAILTAEQVTKLQELRDARRGGHEKGDHRGCMGDGPGRGRRSAPGANGPDSER